MRTVTYLLSLLLVGGLTLGCNGDFFLEDLFEKDEQVAIADLPQPITAYVAENYPDATITEAEREREKGRTIYEVELNTGEELIFGEDGSFIRLEEDDD